MHIIQYAVRVKGTHRYLPRSQRRDGRGGSHLEPMDFMDPSKWPSRYAKGMMIRTFATRSAAANLLTSWLNGKYYGDWEGEVWVKTQPTRVREDMEIVEVELHLPS